MTYRNRDRATASVSMHRKSGEVWPCSFQDMRADRLTDKQQTYILIESEEKTYMS